MCLESLEPRRLCAATPDASFATNGRLTFSLDFSVLGVLATNGEIYVQGYQRPRNRTVIFKYDDNGVLDTGWGRNGYVVPRPFGEATSKQLVDDLALVRDARTGGLLVGVADSQGGGVAVERYTAAGVLDADWGDSGRVAYAEARTELALSRVVALPHKRVMLALDRAQQRGKPGNYSGRRGGADDVAVLRFDPRGRYDRAFNNGRALTVAKGDFQETTTAGEDSGDKTIVQDYTDPAFGDIQFFDDGTLRVISTREETQQTTTIEDYDGFKTVGRSIYSAESAFVTADGTMRRGRAQSYVLKRVVKGARGRGETIYEPRVAAAGADGAAIAVLAQTDRGASILRVGPGYRAKPEQLPTPLGTRYLADVRRTGDGNVLAQSAGTNDNPNDKPREGPGILSLGRDLAVGRHRVKFPLTYFPGFFFSVYTFDDNGRLLAEGTNLTTDTFELTRYA